jgi:hypothetical protein
VFSAAAAMLMLVTTAGVLAPTASAGSGDAPLQTDDGIGICVDENAINGPALDAIEASLQPYVDQMILDGALDDRPIKNYKSQDVSSDLNLSFEFEAPSSSQPDGGVASPGRARPTPERSVR